MNGDRLERNYTCERKRRGTLGREEHGQDGGKGQKGRADAPRHRARALDRVWHAAAHVLGAFGSGDAVALHDAAHGARRVEADLRGTRAKAWLGSKDGLGVASKHAMQRYTSFGHTMAAVLA